MMASTRRRRQTHRRRWGGLSPWVHNLAVAQDRIERLILAHRLDEADRRMPAFRAAVAVYYDHFYDRGAEGADG